MKEEMIFKYDNNIEVINGIEVDWNKYKGVGNGKILERGRSSYIELCEILHKNNDRLLSDYISARDKILIGYDCGHDPHWIMPGKYKGGKGCPVCAKERCITVGIKGGIDSYSNREEIICDFEVDWSKFKIKSDLKEDNLRVVKNNYLKFLKELNDRGDELIDDFINNKTTTTVKLKCGHTRRITPNNYNKGCKCRICDGIVAKLKRQAKDDLLVLLSNNGHKLLSDYIDSATDILIDFNCGHEPHWVKPQNYKDFDKCPICVQEEMYERNVKPLIDLINNNGHKLLSDYKNDRKSILIDFNCGHEPHWVMPSSYINGIMCSDCKKVKLDAIRESIGKDFSDLVDSNNHTVLSEYVNSSTKVLIDFNCGHEPHWITPSHYKNGVRCPLCKNKGESALNQLLLDMGHKVKRQKKYKDLKDIRLLPYDFYLPQYNLLIELDGIHHYKPIPYKIPKDTTEKERGGEELNALIRFNDRQYKDKLKDEYANNNNIPLLRIDYSDGKIDIDKWKQLILNMINKIQMDEQFIAV